MERTLFIVGAVAWLSTALVYKDGPENILRRFREWSFQVFGQSENEYGETKHRSPLVCAFCTGFWVLFPVLILSHIAPVIVEFFGILGIAAAVRGASNEYGG